MITSESVVLKSNRSALLKNGLGRDGCGAGCEGDGRGRAVDGGETGGEQAAEEVFVGKKKGNSIDVESSTYRKALPRVFGNLAKITGLWSQSRMLAFSS